MAPTQLERSPATTGSVKTGMTMTEKILARASERSQLVPCENVWFNIGVLMTHDVCGPGTIGIFKKEFGKNAKVTFKEPEAAKKACEDPTPPINGCRANCNLASLGARRPRSSANTSPRGCNVGPRSTVSGTAPSNQVQWYYPTGTPAAPFHHQPQAIPFHAYGYSPNYIATDMDYNPVPRKE